MLISMVISVFCRLLGRHADPIRKWRSRAMIVSLSRTIVTIEITRDPDCKSQSEEDLETEEH